MRIRAALVLFAFLGGCGFETVQMEVVEPVDESGNLADIDGFYEVLADDGAWVDSELYGDLWCPSAATVGADFVPYQSGHYVQTEHGWVWVGDSSVSWAVEHYGRWVALDLAWCPWAWWPDRIWGPAWVQFHVGGGMVGWGPLPPRSPSPATGPRVRIAMPPQVRVAIPRVNVAAHRPAPSKPPEDALVATPPGGKLPTLARSGGSGRAEPGASDKNPKLTVTVTSEPRVPIVALVREEHFFGPRVREVMLRGADHDKAITQVKPVEHPAVAWTAGEVGPAGVARPGGAVGGVSPGSWSAGPGPGAHSPSGGGASRPWWSGSSGASGPRGSSPGSGGASSPGRWTNPSSGGASSPGRWTNPGGGASSPGRWTNPGGGGSSRTPSSSSGSSSSPGRWSGSSSSSSSSSPTRAPSSGSFHSHGPRR